MCSERARREQQKYLSSKKTVRGAGGTPRFLHWDGVYNSQLHKAELAHSPVICCVVHSNQRVEAQCLCEPEKRMKMG